MLTPAELALFLQVGAANVKRHLTRETKSLLDEAAAEAKAMIGHELDEWPPLADSTIAQKQRLGFTGQISDTDPLLRTGRLRDSISARSEETYDGAEGVLGSDDDVAIVQELGSSRVPPRPFIMPSLISAQARADRAFGELAVELLTPGLR